MGKYENMMKCAQVRSLANEKQYRNAYNAIQELDIDQITSITDLNTIADVYIQLQKYQEAKNIYLKLYNKFPTRRVVYQLVYLSVKCGELEAAEDYYAEYENLDKSSDRIILRYYIDKAKGAERQVLIRYLEQLKREDYMEEWAYELAKLYHKEGMAEACIQECSDIVLWFGEGLIVEKALLLKYHYTDGADISSEQAIMDETRNLAAELRIAATIAERNEQEELERLQSEREESEAPVSEEPEELETEAEEAEEVSIQETVEEELEETEELEEEAPQAEPDSLTEELESELEEQEQKEREQADREAELLYVKPENIGMDMEYQPVYEEDEEEELAEIVNIVKDMKGEKDPGHIAITGEQPDKNIEISKLLAKELCRQQLLPTSKLARIAAEELNEVNLMDNREKLLGGCLLIEEASKLSVGSIQNLYQFMRKAKNKVVVILSDSEEKMETLLKKNRKLNNMIGYCIEL